LVERSLEGQNLPESKKELRWTELNSLSPFPGFFYEILLEHCAKKSAVADSLLCSEAAQNSLQNLAFKSAVASKGLL